MTATQEGIIVGNKEFGFIFEIAWEVVNKVGGIYTVIRTKAGVTVEELGDDYVLIGPYNHEQCQTEVEIVEPEYQIVKDVIQSMRDEGIHVILISVDSGRKWLESWRKDLWEACHIGIPDSDTESLNVLLFGALVAWFLGKFRHLCNPDTLMIAHFHEWMSAPGLILSRARRYDVATIFTTHATLLGRHLCAGSTDFYNNLDKFEIDKEAGDRQIYHRYCLERAGATLAHVFTTVSQITADEAEYLLKKRPDVITPNGLNIVKYTALHEFQNMHAQSKERIHEFIRGHFYGNLDFDLDKTLYFFTAGRYEFQNKGADMFLESLGRLNYLLKASKSDVTVVAFMIFPGKTNNFNVEALRGQAHVKQLRLTVQEIHDKIGKRIFDTAMSGKLPDAKDLLQPRDLTALKRCVLSSQNGRMAPVVTHNMVDDHLDPILNTVRRIQLFNLKTDRVKVIFFPEFLSKTNPLFPIDYEEFVRGCHMGVFPSYYEPWGYTPGIYLFKFNKGNTGTMCEICSELMMKTPERPECTVMGVPNVSTNLSGFGRFMTEHIDYPECYGIYVIDRRFKSGQESIEQLSDHMFDFCQLTRRQRIILRNRTERLSELLDWKSLGIYYQQARVLAVKKTHPMKTPKLKLRREQMHLRFPRPPSAPVSPALSRQVSDDEDEADAEARCNPDPGELVFFPRRSGSESSS